jgi:hypothetical protein
MNPDQFQGVLKGMGTGSIIVSIVISVILIISLWIVFKKAGQPGWAAIIPIFNFIVLLRVAGRPWWWVFAMLLPIIPFVGALLLLVVMIFVSIGVAKNFGQGAGFIVGLVLLPFIFYPILAFGDYKWQGVIKPAEGS